MVKLLWIDSIFGPRPKIFNYSFHFFLTQKSIRAIGICLWAMKDSLKKLTKHSHVLKLNSCNKMKKLYLTTRNGLGKFECDLFFLYSF